MRISAIGAISAWFKRVKLSRGTADDATRQLIGAVPHMVWTARPDGTVDNCNLRFTDYTGLTAAALTAAGMKGLFEPLDRDHTLAAWHTAISAGTPFRAETRLRRADGEHRWHLLLAEPTRNRNGAILRWVGSCTDIQDQKDAERVLTILAEVTQVLSASLDPYAIADALAKLVAPSEVAFCNVQLYDAERELISIARAGDPAALDAETAERITRAQLAGATVLTRVLSIVPFGMGEEVLGWLIACDVRDELRGLVPELASRLGAAISNANAFAREHRVATTFQRAALSKDVPDVPGLRFSVLYHAAQAEASVGGDWYDAFRLPDGRVVLSVGDVAGSGLEAAVTMASVRQSIRTAVLMNPNPDAVLEAVDRIVRAMGHDRFVTAFVAVFDPVDGEFDFANAGHPPPLLRDAAGGIIELTRGDLPLGLRQTGSVDAGALNIEPGSLLVVYTDGLTEFGRDPEAAYARFYASVDSMPPDAEDVAQRLFIAVAQGQPALDDVAILAVSFGPALLEIGGDRGASRWTFNSGDVARATNARHECLLRLRGVGFNVEELHAAELVYGELVGNAYRHARGAVEVILDVSGTVAVLHVLDSGSGFEFRPRLPVDLMAERGRGLYLVKAFADEFSMQRRRTGGSHARAVLFGNTRVRAAAAMTRSTL
jgi:PAS domain S-box-containing protein